MRAEQITGSVAYHAEGPVWFPELDRLRFVDMLAGDVMTVEPDGSVTRTPTGSKVVSVLRPRAGGGAILARERDVVLCATADLSDPEVLTTLFTDDALRTNEGACDPLGRFYIGTMRYDRAEGGATVTRVDPDGNTQTVLNGVTISNGLGWSPDNRLAYYNDTPTGQVDVFDYTAGGELTDRRPFVVLPDDGHPDGLTVDSEGGVWVALNGSGVVHRYDPAGTLSAVIELPVEKVTACTFGGADLGTLYITTSREDLPDDAQPAAGSIFAAQPGVTGLPPLIFGG